MRLRLYISYISLIYILAFILDIGFKHILNLTIAALSLEFCREEENVGSQEMEKEDVSYISIPKQETPLVFPPTPGGWVARKTVRPKSPYAQPAGGLIAPARRAPQPVHDSHLPHCHSRICPRHAYTKSISIKIVRSFPHSIINSELFSKNERNKNTILWRWPISRPFCPLDHPRQTEY